MTMSRIFSFLDIKNILFLVLNATLCATQHQFGGIIFGRANLDEIFVTLYGETLESCQQNCVDRPKCGALNFHTQFPYECSLVPDSVVTLDVRYGWVHQNRSELLIETLCDNCNVNQTCDRDTFKCVYRECEQIKGTAEFIRLGNGDKVWSRAVLACPNNMYPEYPNLFDTWPIVGDCQDNGLWSFPWRPICADFESVCKRYIAGTGTMFDTKNWSNLLQKDILLVSGPCGVNDSMITSSSNYRTSYYAHWVKFDITIDAWVSGYGDESPYIQVNFDRMTEVKGLKIKGRKTREADQYPTLLNVTYSSHCSNDVLESFVRNRTGGAIFTGSTDGTSIVEHMFDLPINALCVRVNILEYINTFTSTSFYFGMKMDLFGTAILPIL